MADTEWLDDHVELYAIDALTPAETERVRRELDDLSAVELRIYLSRITDIQSAITDLASGFALAAPPEMRTTVLDHVFSADRDCDTPAPAARAVDRNNGRGGRRARCWCTDRTIHRTGADDDNHRPTGLRHSRRT